MSPKRVALVTGASAGIGKAIVRRLIGEGWTVYSGARRVDHMADLASVGAKVLSLDVTDDASLCAAIDGVLLAEGRIDALVNNAGYGAYGALEDVPLSEARHQFDVNVFGLVRMSQLVLPTMRKQRSGTIVNISSMGGRIWMPFGGWYHATKHAVEVLSDVMRVETRPFGVRVVVVEPGSVKTEWGGIAAQHLRTTLETSAYREQGEMMAAVLDSGAGASPDVIARTVARAVNSSRPRARYATPLDAKALIFLRWLLPESFWERFMTGAIRIAASRARSRAPSSA